MYFLRKSCDIRSGHLFMQDTILLTRETGMRLFCMLRAVETCSMTYFDLMETFHFHFRNDDSYSWDKFFPMNVAPGTIIRTLPAFFVNKLAHPKTFTYGSETESEEWSSQLIFQFKELESRSLKKSGLQRDSNPCPPRYRYDALPTELWSPTLIEFISPERSEMIMMWSIYEIVHIWTSVVDESEEWSYVSFVV